MNPFAALLLLCSLMLLSTGAAKLAGWLLDRRDARIDSAYRAARIVAQARAEVRRG